MKQHKHLLPLALAMIGLATTARSQTTDWGTSVGTAPLTYTAAGTSGVSSLTWTIGWFNDGFTPTAANATSWVSNYNIVDTNSEVDYGGIFAVSGHKDDVGSAAYGKQAYIFAFNSLASIGLAGGEALLFAEVGFVFPDVPNQGTFDIANNPFDTADDNFQVIWGRVDRDITASGGATGVVTGGGIFNGTPAGIWEAQAGAFTAVPEPTGTLLGMLGALALLRRKRNVAEA